MFTFGLFRKYIICTMYILCRSDDGRVPVEGNFSNIIISSQKRINDKTIFY